MNKYFVEIEAPKEELEEINGVTFRKFCLVLSGGNKPYSKSYSPAELKALVESEA